MLMSIVCVVVGNALVGDACASKFWATFPVCAISCIDRSIVVIGIICGGGDGGKPLVAACNATALVVGDDVMAVAGNTWCWCAVVVCISVKYVVFGDIACCCIDIDDTVLQ
jgi:hypothetical protein